MKKKNLEIKTNPRNRTLNDRIIIERIGFDDDKHITFLDIYDNKFHEAVFLEVKSRH